MFESWRHLFFEEYGTNSILSDNHIEGILEETKTFRPHEDSMARQDRILTMMMALDTYYRQRGVRS